MKTPDPNVVVPFPVRNGFEGARKTPDDLRSELDKELHRRYSWILTRLQNGTTIRRMRSTAWWITPGGNQADLSGSIDDLTDMAKEGLVRNEPGHTVFDVLITGKGKSLLTKYGEVDIFAGIKS